MAPNQPKTSKIASNRPERRKTHLLVTPGGSPGVPTGLNRPRTAQNRLQTSPKRPKTTQNGSKPAQNGPKRFETSLKRSSAFRTAPAPLQNFGRFKIGRHSAFCLSWKPLGPPWGPPHDRPENGSFSDVLCQRFNSRIAAVKIRFLGLFQAFVKSISAPNRAFWLNNLKPTLALRAELRRAHPTRPRRGGPQTGG